MKKQTKLNWQNLAFGAIAAFLFLCFANSLVMAQDNWELGDEWRRNYKIGDKIRHTISGYETDLQTCTVVENYSGQLMRVECKAFRHWGPGVYTASKFTARSVTKAKTPPSKKTAETDADESQNEPAENDAEEPENKPAKQTGGAGLKLGEYACTGSGGRIMIGLSFKVLPGNRFTNLDGDQSGTFTITGDTVKFSSGHLDGITGRDLKNYWFVVGTQASCGPYN